jgi:NAD(P)-dependent dehydrogenase (short-subunit alcohol dehydrogenase family)
MGGGNGGLLSGRVAVVTGATSGIGREVARGLAALGATTVVVGRGTERSAQVAAALATSTGNHSVESLGVTDLSLLSDTNRLADALLTRYPKIHLLVNNAGAYYRRRQVTSEGHERTWALNVLSPFLLSSRLASALSAGAPARVVNVGSAAHQGHVVDFGALETPDKYGQGYRAYGVSKLELLLLTRELARRFEGAGVTVNAVHPGFVRSGFGKNNGGGVAFVIGVLGLLFGKSVRRGAVTPLFVSSDPSVASVTGRYFSNRKVHPGSVASQDMSVARHLYEVCRELTGAPKVGQP